MINDALKSTERDHDVEVRAQQDDISVFGDPAEIFGPGKALETILEKLGKVGLEPNKKKSQVFGTTEDACTDKPEWLDETFVIEDPVVRAHVEVAEAEAAAAAATAAAAPPDDAEAAAAIAAEAKEAAAEARRVFPERRAHTEFGSAALLWDPRDMSRRSSRRCKIDSADKATRRVPC